MPKAKLSEAQIRDKGRIFLENVKGTLGIQKWTEWYDVKRDDIVKQGGASMLQYFRGSPSSLLQACYPERTWIPANFANAPRNLWNSKEHQENVMADISTKIGVKKLEDWYRLANNDAIKRQGGGYLLQKHNNSAISLVTSTYSEYNWDLLRFRRVSSSFWGKRSNQMKFMKELERKLNICRWTDWYRVTAKDIHRFGGGGLLARYYNNSPSALIISIYPNHPWDLLEFAGTPQSYWKDLTHQRKFVKELEKRLSIKNWTDWYDVTTQQVKQLGGASILQYYGYSVARLALSMYPQHPWHLFEFRTKFTWDLHNTQDFLKHVASQLQISSPAEWRTLSTVQLKDFRGGRSLLKKTESLYGALELAFPDCDWDFIRKAKMSKPQQKIINILAPYVARTDIFVNFRHPSLIHRSGRRAELDVWIPSLKIAIEYQGEHHYHQLWQRSHHPSDHWRRDAEKRKLCAEKGIDLIEVPYWWDHSEENLIAAIRHVKPDFLSHVTKFEKVVPKSQETISRSELWNRFNVPANLATDYHPFKDISGWVLSEKMDGIRCYWDGVNIISRGRHLIDLVSFKEIAALHHYIVDGELWYTRGLRFGAGSALRPDFVAFDLLQRRKEE